MSRLLLVLPLLSLFVIASTCRSLVGADPPTTSAPELSSPVSSSDETGAVQSTATAAPPEFEILLWPGDDAPMVEVPPGNFKLGLDNPPVPQENSGESPAHVILLEGFWIDRYEVTNEHYGRFIDAGGYYTRQYWTVAGWQWLQAQGINAPSYWGRPDFGLPQQPVVSVTWHEAYAYCLWAGKRLPTEAEWEKAARGDDGRLYPWGDEWDCSRGNFDDEGRATPATNECGGRDGFSLTAPVGSYESGQSPYHAHDMAGNVWEWTLSKPEPYPYDPNDGRNLPEGDATRVIRGASWLTYTGDLGGDNHARVTFRAEQFPTTQNDRTGFRCVAHPESQ